MAEGELFVFAGQVYRRDPPPGVLGWLARGAGALWRGLLRPAGLQPQQQQQQHGRQGAGDPAVSLGIGVLLVVAALVALAAASPSAQEGLPKLSKAGLALLTGRDDEDDEGHAEPAGKGARGSGEGRGPGARRGGERGSRAQQPNEQRLAAAPEAKGEEERKSLASQLKALSASMSAERAHSKDEASQQGVATANGNSDGSLAGLLHQALVGVKRLLEEEQLTYAYGVQQTLRGLETKLGALEASGSQRITESDLSFLREGGRKLAEEAEEADGRSSIPRPVYDRLFGLHRTLLGAHEAGLERAVVPRMAHELRTIVMQSPALARKLGPAVERLVNLPPSKVVHEFARLSVTLADADADDPQILSARSYLSSFAGIADELLAAKLLLRVCQSMAEMDHLVEGRKLSEKVFRTHKAATRLWPESLIHHAKEDRKSRTAKPSSGSSGAPVSKIVELHLAVRQEQLRRARAPSASIHEVAAWSHLVNACDDLSSLAFQAPGELQFGSAAVTFVTLLQDLVDELAQRASSWGRASTHSGGDFRYDNLIMESDLTYRKTELSAQRASVKLLAKAAQDTRAVQAVHLHVARLVEDIMPGALTAISVGSSSGEATSVTTASAAADVDVVVCFILGVQNAPSQQLTFARTDVPPRIQTAIFKALEHLELADCVADLEALPRASQEDERVFAMQRQAAAEIGALPSFAITGIPERWRATIDATSFSTSAARKLLVDELSADVGSSASLLVDPLSLRARANDQLVRYFAAARAPPRLVLCALTPDVMVVLAETPRGANSAAQTLARP